MGTTFYVVAFVGLLAYYYFVLRRFNSLGFRMFSLFTFAAVFVCYLCYDDYKTEKAIKDHGTVVSGTVTAKDKVASKSTSSPDNQVTITTKDGRTLSTSQYVSTEEWNGFSVGQPIDLYSFDASKPMVVKVSFERFLSEKWVLYCFPIVLFLIGVGCFIFLRKYKVKVDDDTGAEWLEKDGQVYLDERRDQTALSLKKVNVLSKMIQVFVKS